MGFDAAEHHGRGMRLWCRFLDSLLFFKVGEREGREMVSTVIGLADGVFICDISDYDLDIGFCFKVR